MTTDIDLLIELHVSVPDDVELDSDWHVIVGQAAIERARGILEFERDPEDPTGEPIARTGVRVTDGHVMVRPGG